VIIFDLGPAIKEVAPHLFPINAAVVFAVEAEQCGKDPNPDL
jgi:hypothetical protein